MKLRRRSLGNIRFIGELYRIKMLNGKIMHECIRKLLKETDEESMECLCRLVTTIGAVSFVNIQRFYYYRKLFGLLLSTFNPTLPVLKVHTYICFFVTNPTCQTPQ